MQIGHACWHYDSFRFLILFSKRHVTQAVFFSCKPPQCRMHRRELCTPKGKERANVAVMQIYKYLTAFSSDSPEDVVVMWLQRRLHYHFVFFAKFNRQRHLSDFKHLT